MQCALHPETETLLSCGRRGIPICPKCLVHTPVGGRCKQCADVRPSPIYNVTAPYYLKAVAAGVGLALAGGLVWAMLRGVPFISFFISIAVGMGIGEGISRAVNRKGGKELQIIAATSVVGSFIIGKVFRAMFFLDLSGQDLWRWVFSFDIFLALFLIVGVMYAIGRLR